MKSLNVSLATLLVLSKIMNIKYPNLWSPCYFFFLELGHIFVNVIILINKFFVYSL